MIILFYTPDFIMENSLSYVIFNVYAGYSQRLYISMTTQ